MRATKVMFTEFGLSRKLVSDAGTNIMSDNFKQFCRLWNIDQAITFMILPSDQWMGGHMHKIFMYHQNALTAIMMSVLHYYRKDQHQYINRNRIT